MRRALCAAPLPFWIVPHRHMWFGTSRLSDERCDRSRHVGKRQCRQQCCHDRHGAAPSGSRCSRGAIFAWRLRENESLAGSTRCPRRPARRALLFLSPSTPLHFIPCVVRDFWRLNTTTRTTRNLQPAQNTPTPHNRASPRAPHASIWFVWHHARSLVYTQGIGYYGSASKLGFFHAAGRSKGFSFAPWPALSSRMFCGFRSICSFFRE